MQWENKHNTKCTRKINQSQTKQNLKLKKLKVIVHHTRDPQKVPQDISRERQKIVTKRVIMDHQWGLKIA